jgi:protein TonB
VVATLTIHAALGAGLYAIGQYVAEKRQNRDEPVEVEILTRRERRAPPPKPLPSKVEEPVPERLPEEKKQRRARRARRPVEAVAEVRPPAATLEEQPEPAGDLEEEGEAAPVWVMPDQGPGGTVPVARGTPTTRRAGAGGAGTRTEGKSRRPRGRRTPIPVSVASIRKRPKPIGNTDFIDAHKDYPAEAKRQGIEGSIKVRLVVDAKGQVAEQKLVNRIGYGLDELALRLAKRLRFEPAIDTDGRAVAAVVVWTFHFTLPR